MVAATEAQRLYWREHKSLPEGVLDIYEWAVMLDDYIDDLRGALRKARTFVEHNRFMGALDGPPDCSHLHNSKNPCDCGYEDLLVQLAAMLDKERDA